MAHKEKDHIGFDPVLWVERLREVNDGSQFKPDEREAIEGALSELTRKLVRLRGGIRP